MKTICYVLVFCLFITGCETIQGQSTLIGILAGAGIAKATDRDARVGALIGAVLGAMVGSELEEEIRQRQARIAQLRARNNRLLQQDYQVSQEIRAHEVRIAELQREIARRRNEGG